MKSNTKKTNNKICVVLVVDDLGYGGAERQVVELANNLDPLRFDVHICTLSNNLPLLDQLKIPENHLHVIAQRVKYDFTIIPRLAFLLRKIKADIVHGYLYGEFVGRLAGRLAGTRLVIGSERNSNKPISMLQMLAYRITAKCVDFIIANSNTGAIFNGKKFKRPTSDYRVIHNGVDTERFKPQDRTNIRLKLGIPSSCPVIGIFAAFRKQKNHTMVFQAFKLILNLFSDARLLIVGDQPVDQKKKTESYKTDLYHMVNNLGIYDQCLFLGHQKEPENIYSVCDVTVLSSFHEGTPNVLLESMACGVPVVATNICDNEYIVRHGQTGYLVKLGDIEAMADRIISLLDNETTRKEMGLKARQWVLGEFSTKRLAEKTASVYMELLEKKHGHCLTSDVSTESS